MNDDSEYIEIDNKQGAIIICSLCIGFIARLFITSKYAVAWAIALLIIFGIMGLTSDDPIPKPTELRQYWKKIRAKQQW